MWWTRKNAHPVNVPKLPLIYIPLKLFQLSWDFLLTEKSKIDFQFADDNYNIYPYFNYQNCQDSSNNVISIFTDKNEEKISRAQAAIHHGIDKIRQFGKDELQNEAIAHCKQFNLKLENGQVPSSLDDIFKIFQSDEMIKTFQTDHNKYFQISRIVLRSIDLCQNCQCLHCAVEKSITLFQCTLGPTPSNKHVHCLFEIASDCIEDIKHQLKRIEYSSFNCVYYKRKPKGTKGDDEFKRISLGQGVHAEQNKRGGWVKYVKPSVVNPVDVATQEFVAAWQGNLTRQSSIEKIWSVWEGEYIY